MRTGAHGYARGMKLGTGSGYRRPVEYGNAVIASEAKQGLWDFLRSLDCFVASLLAMTAPAA